MTLTLPLDMDGSIPDELDRPLLAGQRVGCADLFRDAIAESDVDLRLDPREYDTRSGSRWPRSTRTS